MKGIEPLSTGWKPVILPLNYTDIWQEPRELHPLSLRARGRLVYAPARYFLSQDSYMARAEGNAPSNIRVKAGCVHLFAMPQHLFKMTFAISQLVYFAFLQFYLHPT